MNSPRYNRFSVLLPTAMLPKYLIPIYVDILKDAKLDKLYSGNPISCLQESLLGISSPGVNLKLVTQDFQSNTGNGKQTTYFAKEDNASKIRPDDSLTLTFRHIDGFHNYWMLHMALIYFQDHTQQALNGEEWVEAGDLTVKHYLTDSYSIMQTYQRLIYESIDGLERRYSNRVQTGDFKVSFKFIGFRTDLYKDDKLIMNIDSSGEIRNKS